MARTATEQKVAREWGKGMFPEGFEVLDIGAGTTPAPGATRAVDIKRSLLTKQGKLKKKIVIPPSLVEYINYDARRLPYSDQFFDRAISRWAIGARIKGIAVIREAHRVLKQNGEMYIAILEEDRTTIPPTKRNLRRAGFKILGIYKGEYLEGKGTVAKEQIIHVCKEGGKVDA